MAEEGRADLGDRVDKAIRMSPQAGRVVAEDKAAEAGTVANLQTFSHQT